MMKNKTTNWVSISDTVSNWHEFAEITGVEKALKEKIGKTHLVL